MFLVRWFYLSINRLIPVTIAVYRYLLVCRNQATEQFGKEKLGKVLNVSTHVLPFLHTIGEQIK